MSEIIDNPVLVRILKDKVQEKANEIAELNICIDEQRALIDQLEKDKAALKFENDTLRRHLNPPL